MKLMKRVLLLLLLLLGIAPFIGTVQADVTTTTEVDVHYFRYAADYTGWDLWVWESEPESLKGAGYSFVTDDTTVDYNYGGVVSKIELTGTIADATQLGFIVRQGGDAWSGKDVGTDRYIDIPATSEGGVYHVYLVEGDSRVGTSINDPSGPDKSPKFKSAYFISSNTIQYTATEILTANDISLTIDGTETSVSINPDGLTGTIVLPSSVDFSKQYVITATFSDSSIKGYVVTYDGIYDSEEFTSAFTYTGDDLGAVVQDNNTTTFRVWAPVSTMVTLNLYDTGTPASLDGTDTPTQTIAMDHDVMGTWLATVPGNLHGTYYTYSVTNGSTTSEVVDPYAKGVGINGLRGLVVDFSQVNPTGFQYDSRPDNMTNYTDAVIYELHVRDLTADSTWTGSETNRYKYLGLVESGTTYDGVATGFDHIVDLGVTHVQLMPIFDFGVLDESKVNTDGYNSFNWGYMPMNFNAPEGSYSSDPYDGLVRITELKEVVMGFAAADIRVNMDVVYNHTGLSADSNFNLIVPGYYYRMTTTGSFSNGSGTGNETATERNMMRKFVVDSVCFWANEYNISGFRFDLMALIDVQTMEDVATALHAIDPTIMVYGEPWTGGTTTLPTSEQSGKTNLYELNGVAAFNDETRDGIKGSVFNKTASGFVQGVFTAQIYAKVEYGIVGGISYPGISASLLSAGKVWNTSPVKTINYVACHDNNTLYDKLYQTLEPLGELSLLEAMDKQAMAIVLLSEGIPFILSGDEFLRSKPSVSGTGFDSNSYESPDSVNSLKWNLLASEEGQAMNAYYKGLIELRKAHASFRMPTAQDVIDNLSFVYTPMTGMIAYTLTNDASDDAYSTILVVHNANDKAAKLQLPENGGWIMVVDGDSAGTTQLASYKGGSNITVSAHTSVVLYQDTSIGDVSGLSHFLNVVSGGQSATATTINHLPTIVLSIGGGVVFLAALAFVGFKFVLPKIRKGKAA